MKYIKFLAFLMAVVSLSACSDKDDDKIEYNTTGGVTVSMKYADLTTMESRGIIDIPFEVTGETNGYVTVTCQVQEISDTPAMEDVHYYLTDETVNVATGETSGSFEIRLVDDRELNDGRSFLIKIVDVQGATVGNMSQTTVFIDDNDDKPYDRLDGDWYVTYAQDIDADPKYMKVSLKAYGPEDYGYGYSYMLFGLFSDGLATKDGYDTPPVQVMFHYDEATKEGDISISTPQSYLFKDYDGTWDLAFLSDDWGLIKSGKAVFTWNEDITELELVSSPNGDHANLIIYQGNSLIDACFEITKFTRDIPEL